MLTSPLSSGLLDDRPQPEETQIVIIGGGVVGVSAALILAEWGVPVVLCEKGRIAGEQSSRNWGWIRKQGRLPNEIPLMIESQDLWKRFADQSADDFGYRVGGVTYLAENDADMERHDDWMAHARSYQLDSRILARDEIDTMVGTSDHRFKGALHTPSDAYAEPRLAVPSIAKRAETLGATILEGTAVRGISRTAGRITGVVTEHGEIKCEAVILAGGIWSRPFMENIGLDLPQLAVKSSVLRTSAAPMVSTSTFGSAGASIRYRKDGGYTIARSGAAQFDIIPAAFNHLRAFVPVLKDRWRIMKVRAGTSFFGPLGRKRWQNDEVSPFESVRVMDPVPDMGLLNNVMETARGLYPQLAYANPVETWAGMIDVMPDETPVIDEIAEMPGLIVATGLSGHGFGIGPGVGLLAAQMATAREHVVPADSFSISRFSSGKASS